MRSIASHMSGGRASTAYVSSRSRSVETGREFGDRAAVQLCEMHSRLREGHAAKAAGMKLRAVRRGERMVRSLSQDRFAEKHNATGLLHSSAQAAEQQLAVQKASAAAASKFSKRNYLRKTLREERKWEADVHHTLARDTAQTQLEWEISHYRSEKGLAEHANRRAVETNQRLRIAHDAARDEEAAAHILQQKTLQRAQTSLDVASEKRKEALEEQVRREQGRLALRMRLDKKERGEAQAVLEQRVRSAHRSGLAKEARTHSAVAALVERETRAGPVAFPRSPTPTPPPTIQGALYSRLLGSHSACRERAAYEAGSPQLDLLALEVASAKKPRLKAALRARSASPSYALPPPSLG